MQASNVLQREYRGSKASFHTPAQADSEDYARQQAVNRFLRKARESGISTDYARQWIPALLAAPMFPTLSSEFLVLGIGFLQGGVKLEDFRGEELEQTLARRFLDGDLYAAGGDEAAGEDALAAEGGDEEGAKAGPDASSPFTSERERASGAKVDKEALQANRELILLRAKTELLRYLRMLSSMNARKYPPDV